MGQRCFLSWSVNPGTTESTVITIQIQIKQCLFFSPSDGTLFFSLSVNRGEISSKVACTLLAVSEVLEASIAEREAKRAPHPVTDGADWRPDR